MASAQGAKLIASPTDPGAAVPTGGVAVLAVKRANSVQCKPHTGEFAEQVKKGRAVCALVDVGAAVLVA
eukprot:13203764-Alexandrium_andersonii.AAC.1